MSSEFMEKHLKGKSKLLSDIDGIMDDFDLFFFTVGWESRCTKIVDYDSKSFAINHSIILAFRPEGEKGFNDQHLEKISTFVESKSKLTLIDEILDNDNESLDTIGEKIEKIVFEQFKESKKPLKIGFDISSCPRYFYLRLLGFCLKLNIAKKLFFFYSEGDYDSKTEFFVHTKGEWNVLTEIPHYNGIFNPEYKNFYVISAGFEGSKYRNLIYTHDPDEIGVLLPNPGFKEEYTQKSIEECNILREQVFIPNENFIHAYAGDAIAAWEALTCPSLNKGNCNITYLTVGPKPHALAMGIHGFLSKNIMLTYRIPKGYTKMEVTASDKFWQYEIENMALF